jgi:hypothetical protein
VQPVPYWTKPRPKPPETLTFDTAAEAPGAGPNAVAAVRAQAVRSVCAAVVMACAPVGSTVGTRWNVL